MISGARDEERRLRRIFGRAVCLALAAPAGLLIACGDAPIVLDKEKDAGTTVLGDTGPDAAKSCDPVSYQPTPADPCGNFIHLPCGLPANVVPGAGGGCFLLLRDCAGICPGSFVDCHAADSSCSGGGVITPDATGNVDIDCSICAGGTGRVPAGLARARKIRGRSEIGDWFAMTSHLEAASVYAFRRLRSELEVHDAPVRLLRAARSAQRDEVRHARLTARMARRFGGAPRRPRVERMAPRPLEVVAIENAVEGCVRETFGALLASFQAATAEDPEIARMMRTIARDETRHAALSWAVAEWASLKLDPEARERLVARCLEAVEALEHERGFTSDDLARRAGIPRDEQRRALVFALKDELWSSLPKRLAPESPRARSLGLHPT